MAADKRCPEKRKKEKRSAHNNLICMAAEKRRPEKEKEILKDPPTSEITQWAETEGYLNFTWNRFLSSTKSVQNTATCFLLESRRALAMKPSLEVESPTMFGQTSGIPRATANDSLTSD